MPSCPQFRGMGLGCLGVLRTDAAHGSFADGCCVRQSCGQGVPKFNLKMREKLLRYCVCMSRSRPQPDPPSIKIEDGLRRFSKLIEQGGQMLANRPLNEAAFDTWGNVCLETIKKTF